VTREEAFAQAFKLAAQGGRHHDLKLFQRDKGTVVVKPAPTPRRFLSRQAVRDACAMLSVTNQRLYIAGRL
jgi:hypothetical protein